MQRDLMNVIYETGYDDGVKVGKTETLNYVGKYYRIGGTRGSIREGFYYGPRRDTTCKILGSDGENFGICGYFNLPGNQTTKFVCKIPIEKFISGFKKRKIPCTISAIELDEDSWEITHQLPESISRTDDIIAGIESETWLFGEKVYLIPLHKSEMERNIPDFSPTYEDISKYTSYDLGSTHQEIFQNQFLEGKKYKVLDDLTKKI